jgi:hypothetical protein
MTVLCCIIKSKNWKTVMMEDYFIINSKNSKVCNE